MDTVYHLKSKPAGDIYKNVKYEIQKKLSSKINYFTQELLLKGKKSIPWQSVVAERRRHYTY